MSSKANISAKDERILHSKSGNRCAMCKELLVDPSNINATCIGENAHIYGEKPTAARYDKNQSEEFVNSEKNLIFLCRNCHKKIDGEETSYPPEYLFDVKQKHEIWVRDKLQEGMLKYSFAELEVLANHLMEHSGPGYNPSSLELLQIEEKIQKNTLENVQSYITMGLTSNKVIVEFINSYPSPKFASKINGIMSGEYNRLKNIGLENVEIFYELWKFASGGREDFEYKAAGLGILTYFFEECEVFEK